MSKNSRPIITPPIQRVTLNYFLTRGLVKFSIKRFHRLTTVEGQENLPKVKCPTIFVSNHQNGMMDPMVISGLVKAQLHWLTRADVFWKPLVRKILMSYNQLPIYRQRDKLNDLRERNNVIWTCCADRLENGAALSIFPEGNHNPKKTIRQLKRGLSELLVLAVGRHKELKRLKIIPLGIDYENYPEYRRRLSFRIGEVIEWNDLYDDEAKSIDYIKLAERVQVAIRMLTTDIRPNAMYDDIYPYVRALNTSKAIGEKWVLIRKELDRIALMGENKTWRNDVIEAAKNLRENGFKNHMRSESWGLMSGDIYHHKLWAVLLTPISWVANLPSAIQQFIINRYGENVKAIEFRSTLKVAAAMFIYPTSWTIIAIVAGLYSSQFWIGFLGVWAWATFGNKFYSWLQGHLHDRRDAIEGNRFWEEAGNHKLRKAWENYIESIQKDIVS